MTAVLLLLGTVTWLAPPDKAGHGCYHSTDRQGQEGEVGEGDLPDQQVYVPPASI